MVAAQATLDPQMAAKPEQAATVTMARPPLRLPIHLLTAQYRSSLTPDLNANCPMRRNNGTTL